LFAASDILLTPPFIKGERGAVFTIVETYLHLLREKGIESKDPVGVVGVGYLGSRVTHRLEELGCASIVGYDIRIKETSERGAVTRTNDPSLLADCKMVIVLTPKGEDAAGVLSWLKEGVVVIDDTHPQLPPGLIHEITLKGGEVYRSTMGLEGVRSVPRLPGYDERWIPGCVVESLVVNGGLNNTTQEAFDQKGRGIGLTPFLTNPRGEG
jgi:threonine dehydrogenase-like Zn-dependent dehydrogenase